MSHRRQRIQNELEETRNELLETARGITPEEFVWEPRPGMKSAQALLREIGTMEKMHTAFLAQGQVLPWQDAVLWRGDTLEDVLADLNDIREETLGFLSGCSDEEYEEPRAIPEPWQQWWGAQASPEQILHWIARHEYYHLGQLIYNRWLLGHNPYEGA